MRTVLITGPGGSGRSTVAAATAAHCAHAGLRTLLLCTDREPAPATALLRAAPPDPGEGPPARPGVTSTAWDTPVEPNLFVRLIDPAAQFRDEATRLQARVTSAMDLFGVVPLDREELTEPPGTAELALLRTLRDTALSNDWDVIVVDCPPVTSTVTALALPEQLRRYLDRFIPAQRQAARALRPLLASLAGVPIPPEWLYAAASWAEDELTAAQQVLDDNTTTVRLVIEPGPHTSPKARAARAALALYGHRLEAVVANRVLPQGSADPWLADLSTRQRDQIKALREDFAGVPLYELPYLKQATGDLAGLADLATRADLAVSPRAGGAAPPPWSVQDATVPEGEERFVWRLPLPGAERAQLDLVRRGDELVVDVGPHRRILPLPAALRRCTVSGAALREGVLSVRFTPDPDQWPTG